MVQTGPALALIAVTMLSMLLLYFATIKYVSDVLVVEDDHGDDAGGGPAA